MKLIAAFALVLLVGSSSAGLISDALASLAGSQLESLFPGMTTDEILATYHPCVVAAPDCGPGYCCDNVVADSTVGFCLPTVAPGGSCLVARQCVCGSGYDCVADGFFGIRGKCLAV